MPALPRKSPQYVIILSVKLDVVPIQVLEEFFGTKNLGNLDQLIRIAVPVKERLLAEDHRRKHGTQRPHVERVIIFLKIHQQLRSLEISRGYPHIVFGAWMVQLGEPPIDQSQLSSRKPSLDHLTEQSRYLPLFVVDHDVMWLHVPMHDALAMAEVEGFEKLKDIVTDVIVHEPRVEATEVGIINVFEH